jgi:transposase
MARHRLTDEAWELIEHLFPKRAATGRPPADRRTIFEGILWILHTGAPWRDLPDEFGPWSTVWEWFDRWNHDGTLTTILSSLQAAHVEAGQIDSDLWCVDGSVVRAARCCGGGAKKAIPRSQLITH